MSSRGYNHDPRWVSKRIYPLRITGMGLGGLAAGVVLWELDAPAGSWLFLLFICFVWPHLAYLLTRLSRQPARMEQRCLLIDSALAGALVPVIHFNLLPSTLLVTLTTVDKITTGIRGLWLRSIPALVGAGLVSALIVRPSFSPSTDMPVVLGSMPLLLIHTIAVAIGSHRLIQKVTRQNQELDQLRRIDGLTGVSRRDDWTEQATALLANHDGQGNACILLIDFDRFKQINDRYGHLAGDEVLRSAAKFLIRAVRPNDRIGRLGGDEFAVLLPDTTESEARALADTLCRTVQSIRLRDYPDITITISIGVAAIPPVPDKLAGWLRRADESLYRAKHQGRNTVGT